MEEEGRRTLQLMPGAQELIDWLTFHNILMALVTWNTKRSANVLVNELLNNNNGSNNNIYLHPSLQEMMDMLPNQNPEIDGCYL